MIKKIIFLFLILFFKIQAMDTNNQKNDDKNNQEKIEECISIKSLPLEVLQEIFTSLTTNELPKDSIKALLKFSQTNRLYNELVKSFLRFILEQENADNRFREFALNLWNDMKLKCNAHIYYVPRLEINQLSILINFLDFDSIANEKKALLNRHMSQHGFSYLVQAYKERRFNLAEFLILNGVDVDSHEYIGKNKDCKANIGSTPLIEAAKNGHDKIVELLLKKGANAKRREGETKRTALMYAVINGYANIVKRLLKKSNINAVDRLGYSALAYAVEKKNSDINVVKMLVEASADLENIPFAYRENRMSCIVNDPEIREFLRKAEMKPTKQQLISMFRSAFKPTDLTS